MSRARGAVALHWTKITAKELSAAAERYKPLVSDEIAELEEQRRTSIPDAVRRRKAEEDGAFVEKSEMMKLVKWKSKQKASPYAKKLVSLAESNDEGLVKAVTADAFKKVDEDVWQALQSLIQMKGIGPATASLILSCDSPADLPFFSDPLYRWFHLEETADGELQGWDRAIKYNSKEYQSLYSRLQKLKGRLQLDGQCIGAVQIEQAAYVLQREQAAYGSQEDNAAEKRKANGRSTSSNAETQLRGGEADQGGPEKHRETKRPSRKKAR